MKRAKQRKFREPPFWVKIFHSVRSYEDAFRDAVVTGRGVLLTGEIGRIDCGFRFIQTTR